jgi:hypothetical protein
MLERIISGGQSGANQAGWRAANAAGIPTGGAMPLGFMTEDGPRPEFEQLYGAHQLDTADYLARTEANVKASDGTLLFGRNNTPGALCVFRASATYQKPYYFVPFRSNQPIRPTYVARWIALQNIKVLNVAGNTESGAPGIGARVEAFLGRLFALAQRPARGA